MEIMRFDTSQINIPVLILDIEIHMDGICWGCALFPDADIDTGRAMAGSVGYAEAAYLVARHNIGGAIRHPGHAFLALGR